MPTRNSAKRSPRKSSLLASPRKLLSATGIAGITLFAVAFTGAGYYLATSSHAAGYKFGAPDTDLVDFPKADAGLTLGNPLASTVQQLAQNQDEVMAVTSVPGGSGELSLTSYSVAPGYTAKQLYASLKGRGVKGLLDPSASVTSYALVGDPGGPAGSSKNPSPYCVYGYSTYSCFAGNTTTFSLSQGSHAVHWPNRGHSHPQIYFSDHTGAAWPINTAVYVWNRAQGIDSLYHPCPGSGYNCVAVSDANYGKTGWSGLTSFNFTPGIWIINSAVTKFNDYPYAGLNAIGHRESACHELGHALGLQHSQSPSSCMYYAITNSAAAENPSASDFALLAYNYNGKVH